MALAEYRLFLDNEPASDEQLERFGQIRVDQAIGMAAEAELHLLLEADEEGNWDGMDEDFAQPFARVRIEVGLDDGEFVPLIDGPIVAQRFELSSAPAESEMILVVQDDSVLLNQEEEIALFEDMAAHEIVEQLFDDFGLEPDVEEVPDAGSALTRAVVQRGSAMQLLRELARRHGMFAYVRPGPEAGTSIGVFRRPNLAPSELPELLLMGEDRNVEKFSAEFDALKPMKARADSVSITDKTPLTSETETPDLDPLGDEAAHDVIAPAPPTRLARTREEQSDLDEATFAAVNLSSFAYSASAELSADNYAGVLQPYVVVSVAGAGGVLSGNYLISRVTHLLDDSGYTQQVNLRRNARSAGSTAGAPGGIV
jgi:phage protein D